MSKRPAVSLSHKEETKSGVFLSLRWDSLLWEKNVFFFNILDFGCVLDVWEIGFKEKTFSELKWDVLDYFSLWCRTPASPSPRRCWPRSGAGSRSCCSWTWCRRSWWGSSAWSPRHCPSGPGSCSYRRRGWAPASSAASCFSEPPCTPRGLPVFLVWSHCTRYWTSSYNGEFSVSVRNALSCNKYQLLTVTWHAPSFL